jgi:beta-glucosidase
VPDSFPDGFLFGAAASAYQIEGAADEGGRGPSIWDTFSHQPGHTHGGDTGDVAADHFHRFRDDVRLMRDMGLQMYRFSVSWPRVLPDGTGSVNETGLDFYRALVEELLAAGIEPMATLFHWDLPQPLQDAGGWPARSTAGAFADYARVVHGAIGDRVSWWATINEPWCAAFLGHASGVFAPGVRDPAAAFAAAHHLLLAHGMAVQAMRAEGDGRHGIPVNPAPIRLGRSDEPDVLQGARVIDGLRNRLWLDALLAGAYPADVLDNAARFGGLPVVEGDMAAIAAPLDWLGVNYYHDLTVDRAGPGAHSSQLGGGVHPGAEQVTEVVEVGPLTDMGWPITPPGLYDQLDELRRRYPGLPPMLVSENGCAYDDPIGPDGTIADLRRIEYLDAHLRQVLRALEDGIDVRGYLVWSILDNFEWAEGYGKRFGLVHVDYETQRRTPRRSAGWYRSLIETRRLSG